MSNGFGQSHDDPGVPGWVAPVLTAVVTVGVYTLTTNPDVGFNDSAELALRASQPGASHAPGAPVHTLTGYLIYQFVDSPVAATNLLSCLSGGLAAALSCLLLLALGTDRVVAFGGAFAFAFSFPVWGNAVVTETYSLSLFLLAGCILGSLRWRQSGDSKSLVAVAGLYGLALGAHFANILLLPAFAYFIFASRAEALRNSCVFLGILLIGVCLIAVANIALAANVPSFGRYNPDSIAGLFLYMSGAEHDPLGVTGAAFYLDRIVNHALIFSRHYLFVLIPAGLAGAWILSQRNRVAGIFLVLVFLLYMGYFTLFGAGDYYVMVSPAYLVFSIWVATAVDALVRNNIKTFARLAGQAVLPLTAILFLVSQLPVRYADARSDEVGRFAEESFNLFPADSIVLARWSDFTVLNYYQHVNGIRPDVRIILPVRNSRQYPHGMVSDYLPFVAGAVCEQSVVTNKLTEDLNEAYRFEPLSAESNWYRIIYDVSNCVTP